MAKIVQITETKTIDESGEIYHNETSTVINLPSEPPYVKMYIDDLSRILDISAGPRSVLYQLVQKMGYDGYISLTAAAKKRMAESCKITVGTLSNYLTDLCRANVLRNVDRGEYEMNPNYFAKGEWKDISRRRRSFELSILYGANGERKVRGKLVPFDDEETEPTFEFEKVK